MSAQSTSSPPCEMDLMRLPAEIRLMIYKYFVPDIQTDPNRPVTQLRSGRIGYNEPDENGIAYMHGLNGPVGSEFRAFLYSAKFTMHLETFGTHSSLFSIRTELPPYLLQNRIQRLLIHLHLHDGTTNNAIDFGCLSEMQSLVYLRMVFVDRRSDREYDDVECKDPALTGLMADVMTRSPAKAEIYFSLYSHSRPGVGRYYIPRHAVMSDILRRLQLLNPKALSGHTEEEIRDWAR